MNRKDAEALRAVRKSTLKSIRAKRDERLKQLKEQYTEQVREVSIKYAKDPERLRAKYAADDYAKSEKAKKKAAKQIEREKLLLERDNSLRQFTIVEEIASSVLHGMGALLSVAATVVLVLAALQGAPKNLRAVFISTFVCTTSLMIVMYIMHTLHHALTAIGAKEVFHRLAHCFIFLVMGSAYTIFTLTAFSGSTAWILFGCVWFVSVVGIVFSAVFGNRVVGFRTVLYLVIGWAALFPIRELKQSISAESFKYLITCGIFYTVGIAFLFLRKVKYMHAIGDALFLCGTIYFFFALFYMV